MKGISKRDPESVLVEHVVERHNNEFELEVLYGLRMNRRETHTKANNRSRKNRN